MFEDPFARKHDGDDVSLTDIFLMNDMEGEDAEKAAQAAEEDMKKKISTSESNLAEDTIDSIDVRREGSSDLN